MCTKANRTLGFLRRNLYQCPQDVKGAAYRGLLEYGSCVWDPQCVVLQQEIEKVQNRAARFVTSNYSFETGSMTGILENLKWASLKKRRRDSRLILLYKGLKKLECPSRFDHYFSVLQLALYGGAGCPSCPILPPLCPS